MKGIVLAGGTGSRLWPITRSVSKQLLPIYDKPMIYYPISTLMLAGIRDILLITTKKDQHLFKELLGDGSSLGVNFEYMTQDSPRGIAEALIIGENFIGGEPVVLILGDNIFHGAGLGRQLYKNFQQDFVHIFTYEVNHPEHYGVLNLDESGEPESIVEKPIHSSSNLAITGMYYLPPSSVLVAKKITPGTRGELEITDVLGDFLEKRMLVNTRISRGGAWLDTGNPNALHDASTYVRVIEERTGLKIGCIEEIAFRNEWITVQEMKSLIETMGKTEYAEYLKRLIAN